MPESGDSIQAMKAGLMEIADFFVLNKSDRAGADQALMSIKMILAFRKNDGWTPDVLKAIATEGQGTEEIAAKITEHRKFLELGEGLKRKRRQRLEERVRELVADRLRVDFWANDRLTMLSEKLDTMMKMTPATIRYPIFLLPSFHSSY